MQLAADAGQKHDAAAFISTTYKILDAGYEEIAWNADGKSFVIRNPERFAERILPEYFNHSQYSSWVRAANAYDFKKTSKAGVWEHPDFQRGRPDLLSAIKRKPPPKRKPKPKSAAAPPPAEEAAGASAAATSDAADLAWPLEQIELMAIIEQEKEGLEFMTGEMRRLEEEAAQVQAETAADEEQLRQLLEAARHLLSETRALRPLDGPAATEFAAQYECPLRLPGFRMLGVHERCDFDCTHALLARHPAILELAKTPEIAAQIEELRAKQEQLGRQHPELCLSVERNLEALPLEQLDW